MPPYSHDLNPIEKIVSS
ncbi:hypothetical protein ACA351_01925 [Orientia tsutsugamushi]